MSGPEDQIDFSGLNEAGRALVLDMIEASRKRERGLAEREEQARANGRTADLIEILGEIGERLEQDLAAIDAVLQLTQAFDSQPRRAPDS